MKGIFITLEGPDGCGKTCQIQPLAESLSGQGFDVVTTREPGGTEISEQIRHVIMDMSNKGMHPRTEILLFQAARAQHVEQLIRPALAEGKIVICDRYMDSTMAYQGYGHQTDLQFLRKLLEFTTGNLVPDITLLLDLDAEEGLKRRLASSGEWNRMDDYDLDFHRRVRAGYHELAHDQTGRWVTIDASASKSEIQAEIQTLVLSKIQSIRASERLS
jgi:dTMP kinase